MTRSYNRKHDQLRPVTIERGFVRNSPGSVLYRSGETAVLVTDATAATGMPNGRYRLGSFEVDVKDGKCLVDGKLAGSVLTMDKAVRNIVKFANWDLQQAIRLATANPARTTGLPANAGTLVPGATADVVALSPGGDVLKTIVRGQVA